MEVSRLLGSPHGDHLREVSCLLDSSHGDHLMKVSRLLGSSHGDHLTICQGVYCPNIRLSIIEIWSVNDFTKKKKNFIYLFSSLVMHTTHDC